MLYLRKRKVVLKKGLMLFGLLFISLTILQTKTILLHFLPFKIPATPSADVGLVIFVCLLAYKPLDQFVNFLFREFFFKKGVGFHAALLHSANHLIACLDLKEFSNLLVNTLSDLIEVKYASFLLYQDGTREYFPGAFSGFDLRESRKIQLRSDSPLIEELRRQRYPILRYEILKTLSWPEASRLNSDFEVLRAQVVIPILRQGEVRGLITLSSKPSHEAYLPHELKLFHDFASRIGTALENVIRYEEIRKQYDDLKDFQSRLLQTNKFSAIEQLATGIAHEIHNPLTIISGKAQMLLLNRDKNFLTQKAEKDLKMIVEQSTRAAEITRKLLVFSKSSPEQKEAISFKDIVDDTFELISYQTSLERIQVIKDLSPELPVYKGHVEEFREIFLNLVLNAVQSVEREGSIRVSVQYAEGYRTIEIRVEDTGCGILKEHMANVFDPFFTTKQNSLGLGLFVTQRIVQRNGGSIRMESESSKGTQVIIELPVSNEKEEAFPKPAVLEERNLLEEVLLQKNRIKEV